MRATLTDCQLDGLREVILRSIHGPTARERELAAHELVGCMASVAGVDLATEIDNAQRRRARERAAS